MEDGRDEADASATHVASRSKSSVTWDDVAGVERGRRRADGGRRDSSASRTHIRSGWGTKTPKGLCSMDRPPKRQDAACEGAVAHESGANSTPQAASSFVECSAGLGAAAFASSRGGAQETRPRSSSSTRLDAGWCTAQLAMVYNAAGQTLNQLLVELDGSRTRSRSS